MYTPGQLIHRQRELRAWTQRELADRCRLSQSQLSVYEAGAREPTWSVLCRILAAMGLQPRVTAEECDVSQHHATAEVRDLRRVWAHHRGLEGTRMTPPPDLGLVMQPSLSDSDATLRTLKPVSDLVEGLPSAFTGRTALRLLGLGCAVPCIDVLVAEQDPQDLDELCLLLSNRIGTGQVSLWSPEVFSYLRCPSPMVVRDIARLSGNRLCLRTRETGSEVRLRLDAGPLPPYVVRTAGALTLAVQTLDDLDDDAVEAFDAARNCTRSARTATPSYRQSPQSPQRVK
jgi:transcriptional regulator with XRE-family HTH domain